MIGIDVGSKKESFAKSIGVQEYLDFRTSTDVVGDVQKITAGGAHAVIVAAGSPEAYSQAAEMLRIGGTLSCVGIPPRKAFIETPVSTIVIKGLRITGNLVGSLKECLEAVELVRRGIVKAHVSVRPFRDLPKVYEELGRGDVMGRIVLKIAEQ